MARRTTRAALALALGLALASTAGTQEPPTPEAVLEPAGAPVEGHEAPVLAALEATPYADAIALRATALHFPDETGESLVALIADLPAGAPSLRPADEDPGTLTQDFTVLAVVRDDSGRIVHKASRRYVLSWPESSLEDLKVGRVLFAREARLAPGRYTIEFAARDAEDGKMGVTRLPLDLPAIDETHLRLSSLVLVGHAETDALGEASPLLYEGVRLYPNLGDPVLRSSGKPLTFLFTLQPSDRPLASATLELLRDGTGVLQSPVTLPSPDPSGRMRVVSGLPIENLEPGDYVLRLSVTNAQGLQARSAPFKLAP